MRRTFLTVVACVAALTCFPTLATEYPTRPIKFVVPFTPGTGMDRIARRVGEKLYPIFKQPVVVENRPGVAGHLGAELVARSSADGYTILVTATNLTITGILHPSPSFNPMRDLVPVGIAAWGNATLVASPNLKVNNLGELLSKAKANPGGLTFATPGVGSPQHIAMEQLQKRAGVRFLHVPYNGTGPALADLMAGHVDVMFVATHTVMAYIKAGQVKALAVGSKSRHRAAPNIPTFEEAGVPGVSTEAWYGFLAPKGTPPQILSRLSAAIRGILEEPDIKADLEQFGLDVRPSTPDEMRVVMQREYEQYSSILKEYNQR